MQTSDISWTDYSWNPITGCSKIGPECTNCYAETFSNRQAQRENPPEGATDRAWTHENADENVQLHPDRLDEPLEYNYPLGPGRVFVGSMTDMFHSESDPDHVQQALDRCAEVPECLWIWLTKRPHRAAEWPLDWPENTMLGVSVGSGPGGEYPNTTHRIEQLRDVDAPQKWVSFEPLVDPVGEVALDHIDWVVVGGETGPAEVRREMEHEWAREILRQAREEDIPFHFKQSSGRYPHENPALSVLRGGVTVQKKIREGPPLPKTVLEARGGDDIDE